MIDLKDIALRHGLDKETIKETAQKVIEEEKLRMYLQELMNRTFVR